jgi:transketolase
MFMQKSVELMNRSINAIRFLSADAVQKANSGHPGLPMGMAAVAYAIWTRHMRHNPANPESVSYTHLTLPTN